MQNTWAPASLRLSQRRYTFAALALVLSAATGCGNSAQAGQPEKSASDVGETRYVTTADNGRLGVRLASVKVLNVSGTGLRPDSGAFTILTIEFLASTSGTFDCDPADFT